MPMVLAPMVSSQSWIAILQEKMARLLAPPADDAAQNLVSIEEMLNNGQSRNCSDATASPTLTPAPAPIAAQPTEVKLLEFMP